jgi:hypothetical protein
MKKIFLILSIISIASCSNNDHLNDDSESIKETKDSSCDRNEDTLDVNDRISIDQIRRMDSLHAAGKL